MRKTLSKKEARAIFIKFLMENNCLQNFIICYKAYNKCDMTPKEIMDKIINNASRCNYYFDDIFDKISISFDWVDKSVEEVMRNMYYHDKVYWQYWSNINKKFKMKCSNKEYGKIVGE